MVHKKMKALTTTQKKDLEAHGKKYSKAHVNKMRAHMQLGDDLKMAHKKVMQKPKKKPQFNFFEKKVVKYK